MEPAVLDVLDQNRKQADTFPNKYGVINISGDGSTILGNVYQNYYSLPELQQASWHASNVNGHNVHWSINRSKNPYYTGRLDLIEKVSKIVCNTLVDSSPVDQCRIVVTGIGGQGKSELCLQVAHRVRSLFWAVWWVDVSTPLYAQRDFQILANQLRMSDSTIDDILRNLANLKHSWLLILDNADDPEACYSQYFPTGHNGVVILTSRNGECKQYGTSNFVALDGLPLIDAQELLLKAAQISPQHRDMCEQDANTVASFLLGHPLAIIQAGAYIQRGHCSLAEYPRVFQQNRKRLLRFRPAQARSRYGDVYATFEASADAIRSINTDAADDSLQLLPMLAMLSSNQLPLSFFEQVWRGANRTLSLDGADIYWRSADLQAISFLPKFIQPTEETWDPYRLLEAVRLLEAYSLLAVNDVENDKCVSMHPLAHAWAKDRQESLLQQESWLTTACSVCVSSLIHRHPSYLDVWALRQRQLRPHLLALITAEDDAIRGYGLQAMVARISYKCAILLTNSGLYVEASNLLQKLFLWLGIDIKTVDPRWLPLYELHATEFLMDHQPQEAISLLEHVVAMSEQELTGNEEFHAELLWRLADAYLNHNQAPKVVELMRNVLFDKENKPIENHLDRVRPLSLLAQAHWKMGQTRKAESLIHKIKTEMDDKERVPTYGYEERVERLYWLADTYWECQKYQKAINTLEQAIAIEENSLAKPHLNRLTSQSRLASMYLQDGQLQKAISMLERLVTIEEQTLGASHRSLLESQRHLAYAYSESGKVEEATAVLEKVVKTQEETYLSSDQGLSDSRYELASVYLKNKKASRAVPLLEKVVELERSVSTEETRTRIDALCRLGEAYVKSGLKEKAIPIVDEVVRIDGCALPEDNDTRSRSQTQIAVLYYHTGRLEEAIQMMQAVVRARGQVVKVGDPDRKWSENWLTYMEYQIRTHEDFHEDDVDDTTPRAQTPVSHQDNNNRHLAECGLKLASLSIHTHALKSSEQDSTPDID